MSARERKPSTRAALGVTARARSRDDRAGEPLDGLVNLFDVGIVLSVAFLLAALSSLNLTEALTGSKSQQSKQTAPQGSVITDKNARVKQVEVKPGEKVVGQGKQIGRVYELSDGRTVIVREP